MMMPANAASSESDEGDSDGKEQEAMPTSAEEEPAPIEAALADAPRAAPMRREAPVMAMEEESSDDGAFGFGSVGAEAMEEAAPLRMMAAEPVAVVEQPAPLQITRRRAPTPELELEPELDPEPEPEAPAFEFLSGFHQATEIIGVACAPTKCELGAAFTVCAMIKVEDEQSRSVFAAAGAGTGGLELHASGRVVMIDGSKTLDFSTQKINGHQWHHVAMSYSAEGGVRFYIDGEQDGHLPQFGNDLALEGSVLEVGWQDHEGGGKGADFGGEEETSFGSVEASRSPASVGISSMPPSRGGRESASYCSIRSSCGSASTSRSRTRAPAMRLSSSHRCR